MISAIAWRFPPTTWRSNAPIPSELVSVGSSKGSSGSNIRYMDLVLLKSALSGQTLLGGLHPITKVHPFSTFGLGPWNLRYPFKWHLKYPDIPKNCHTSFTLYGRLMPVIPSHFCLSGLKLSLLISLFKVSYSFPEKSTFVWLEGQFSSPNVLQY